MSAGAAFPGGRTDRVGRRVSWITAGLLALALILYVFPLTLDIPLVDPDEGLHAAIAQEMVERGDWLTPRLLGQPFLDKPVLFFWAQAMSLDLLGMREAAVRLPGLAFGLLGCLTTGLLGAVLAGGRVGVTSGVFYATMLLPMGLDQAAVHDVALVPWTNLLMLFLWRAQLRSDWAGTLRQAAVAGVFVGLAVLTKGFVGVVLVGVPFAITLA
jgi:4-amino-4-deoxy-L-arabinose transferase-like glycosyltransferase